jgi:hypothetical protein
VRIIHGELEICVDCTMFVANGEVFDGSGNDITIDHAERMREQWGDKLIHMVLSCPEGCEGWFSMSDCDGCGSPLGGERHPAAVLGN